MELVGGPLKQEPDIEVRRLFLEQKKLLPIIGREVALGLDLDPTIKVKVLHVLGCTGRDHIRVLGGLIGEWHPSFFELGSNAVL